MNKTELEQASKEFFEVITEFLSRESPRLNLFSTFEDGMAIQLTALVVASYKASVGLVGAGDFRGGRDPREMDRDPEIIMSAAQAMSAVLADVLESHDPSAKYEVLVRRIQGVKA